MSGVKPKFGLQLPSYPFDLSLKVAVEAEKLGFDSVWYFDDLEGFPELRVFEPFSMLSVVASQTKTVKVGIDVADVNRRHPVHLAQAVATVDVISKGRMITGVGAGFPDERRMQLGLKRRSMRRMRENVEVLKKLWTQDMTNYKGRYFNLSRAVVYPKPIQKPHPPLWIAGNSPKTMQLTAELGDGWFPFVTTPSIFKKDLDKIQQMAKKFGRDPTEIETAYFVFTNVDSDYEAAANAIIPLVKPTLLWASTPQKLGFLGYKRPKSIEDLPDKLVQDFNVYGAPEDCIKQLKKFVDAGVQNFILNFAPLSNVIEKIKIYGEKIIPAFS